MKRTIYLDYAAATPVDPIVLKVMQPYFVDEFYNPSALYLNSQKVSKDLENARTSVASILGVKPAEIIFTAGGTEANNLAIVGLMIQHPEANVVTSEIEHDSVLKPAREFNHRKVKTLPDGCIDLSDLAKKIDDQTVLVSIMYANNEIGTIQPIREVAKIVQKIREERQKSDNKLPLYLHTDACQAANYLDLHVHRLGVDLVTINGGKIYGPKQSGALFVAANVKLEPIIFGGGQELGLRSGTENVAGDIGFAEALKIAQDKKEGEVARLQKLQQQFIDGLQKLPNVTINGSLKNRLPNNVHATFTGQDNERLIMQLDELGIMCAAGSACSASSEEVSHVLHAVGLSDTQAQSSLRFTMGQQTDSDDINFVLKTLAKLL